MGNISLPLAARNLVKLLMTNHVYLLVTPYIENSIGKMMQTLGRYYVQYFNNSYKRTGTLWEGRYKATLIYRKHYLLPCIRYIESNPVRADNMVGHPSEYPWSSYRYHALRQSNSLVTAHRDYKRLGATDAERQAAYRRLFHARTPEMTLEAIRETTNKARVLGSERFKRRIAKQLDRPVTSGGHGETAGLKPISEHSIINESAPLFSPDQAIPPRTNPLSRSRGEPDSSISKGALPHCNKVT